jgi:hypothetical protein
MTVLEFLASYAALFLQRAEAERIGGITVLYNEPTAGKGRVHIGNQHGGIDLEVQHPLFAELTEAYTPELTDEQWDLFKENIRDPAA